MTERSGRGPAQSSGAPLKVQRQSRLSLAALLLAVLALPAALFPWVGLIVAVVVLLVALVALIRALRSPDIARGYPMAAVTVSIVAVALAGVVSNSTATVVRECGDVDDAATQQCIEDMRGD